MTDEQILKKAIEKARNNEFEIEKPWKIVDGIGASPLIIEERGLQSSTYEWSSNDLIFSPDFAKAFFGKEESVGAKMHKIEQGKGWELLSEWRYQQHKMLDEIQEGRSPIKYLEKFL